MRAFLFYIDDWLSSKKIALMDAHEERAYLRLLIRAATEPDCGLPDDDAQLAVFSTLGEQWFKVTKEKNFRMGEKKSGEKLRECFVKKDGRLYNTRLLKEFEYQRQISEKRAKASVLGNAKRWHKDPGTIPSGIPSGIPNGPFWESQSVSQNDPNDVCVYVSTSSSSVASTEVNTEQLPGKSRAVSSAPSTESEDGESKARKKKFLDETHDRFYEAFWLKLNRKRSREAWPKAIVAVRDKRKTSTAEAVEFLIEKVIEQKVLIASRPDLSWFESMYPSSWLNGARWEDEFPAQQKFAASKGRNNEPDLPRLN